MFKSITILCILIFFANATQIKAQTFKYRLTDSLKFVDAANNPLNKALSGGFQAPQFSNCDLNADGKKDLVVYDRIDGSVTTFINKGAVGEVKYELDNRYAAYFPKMSANAWMLMRDYNRDGYEDIFTCDNTASMIVYKNTSLKVSGKPAFEKIPTVRYRNISPKGSFIEYNDLGIPFIHVPGIYDIDFDGDLDILTYTNQGGAIELFKNMQVEDGLAPDSMNFMDADWRWGDFVDQNCNTFILNQGDTAYKFYYRKRHTNGSSICLFDADNDKDIDMVLGNEGCDHMSLLINGKKNYHSLYDSIIQYDTNFVSPLNRAQVWLYPAGYFLDIDNDNKRDFVMAPNSNAYPIQGTNQVFWFKNTGLDLAPVFGQKQLLFTTEFIDNGTRSSWACADLDKDGDVDCLCANNSDSAWKNILYDRIYLYENIGTAQNPTLKLKDKDFGKFASKQISALTLALADMDNDGKIDLVIGNDRGDIKYYKNSSATGNTLSPNFTLFNNTFPGFDINVGFYSYPAVADINGDGLKDLVIGNKDTFLRYYKNVGTSTNPDFSFVTKTFGQASPKDSFFFTYIHDYGYDSLGNPTKDSIVGIQVYYERNLYSAPQIADLNGDGKLELLVGNTVGNLKLYAIDKNNVNAKFKQYLDFYYMELLQNQKINGLRLGNRISPAFVNLEGDSVPEIIISISRGGLNYLKPNFIYKTTGFSHLMAPELIAVYPNPANRYTSVNLDLNDIKSLKIITLNGQVIEPLFESFGNTVIIHTNDLSAGIYFLNIETKAGIMKVAKLDISQ